jgi:hypothetical protein
MIRMGLLKKPLIVEDQAAGGFWRVAVKKPILRHSWRF